MKKKIVYFGLCNFLTEDLKAIFNPLGVSVELATLNRYDKINSKEEFYDALALSGFKDDGQVRTAIIRIPSKIAQTEAYKFAVSRGASKVFIEPPILLEEKYLDDVFLFSPWALKDSIKPAFRESRVLTYNIPSLNEHYLKTRLSWFISEFSGREVESIEVEHFSKNGYLMRFAIDGAENMTIKGSAFPPYGIVTAQTDLSTIKLEDLKQIIYNPVGIVQENLAA